MHRGRLGFDLGPKSVEEPSHVHAVEIQKFAKFNGVKLAFARFDFADKSSVNPQVFGDISLREAAGQSSPFQMLDHATVDPLVLRLFHAGCKRKYAPTGALPNLGSGNW